MVKTVIEIEGMHCKNCVSKVKKSLEEINGVKKAKVKVGKAKIKHEGVEEKEIRTAIKEAGYEVRGE